MPELPEVETVRRGLQELIVGRKVKTVAHDTPKSFPNAVADVERFLIGAKITGVCRRAKVLLIDLSTEYTLVVHLKMTGQMVYISSSSPPPSVPPQGRSTGSIASPWRSARPDGDIPSDEWREAARQRGNASGVMVAAPVRVARGGAAPSSSVRDEGADRATGPAASEQRGAAEGGSNDASDHQNQEEGRRFGAGHPNDSLIGELPDRSTRVTIEFADGSHLYFNDQRKFGWMKLMPTLEVPNIDFMKKVGPEPLEAEFTAAQFAERFKRRAKTSIKAALLDQTVIAGVGNIYADESLWGAKVHPGRIVGTITDAEFKKLYTELRAVMNLAIEKGGSTDKNYVNAEGKRGSYMDFARVFRREGKPCPRCGAEIIKFKHAGRGTHVCPVCQKH